MQENETLKRRMAEAGFTQAELAEAVNADLRSAGYEGTVSDRTVRNWLTGKSRWPHQRQRAALEALFDCPVTDLGFVPRRPPAERVLAVPEDAVLRRRFLSASTSAALTAVGAPTPPAAARNRVGMSDVERLYSKFAAIIANDHRYGGKVTIEAQAAALAGEALAVQSRGRAGQRVRGALYGCAASFTSSAMWAAIDGLRFDAAQRHFHRAASLAAMSGDSTIQFRIWSHAGSLYRHMARPADALAANDVARHLPIARRDPMFASLGHARQAAIHGLTGDVRAVRQALAHADRAFERASATEPRPVWMAAVCNRAEIEELALSAHLGLGKYEEAEAHAHRSLALLRPSMQRDRTVVTARLALALLGQRELDAAIDTARSVPAESMRELPRVSDLMRQFGTTLHTLAPSSTYAVVWDEHVRDCRRSPR
ncbi:helix-turn-helix transcriptional regulator [Streptomyces sp. TRM 70351]|uniref:helix-turn-helix transcriptional regulator n=1 Tax=Streptomyces sp. TRM 70351 TaxID=3116552 RepID=UPI002E7BC202|nr:helix-turn-helix transcriptional regulator [Streptomyces sp. TRM 70351]MEE1929580.1 helix-turn-helix transcriptional regulator [Streptomyces sp. TRM 70351]